MITYKILLHHNIGTTADIQQWNKTIDASKPILFKGNLYSNNLVLVLIISFNLKNLAKMDL